MRLQGKVVLVAGAGGGIGTAVPVLFAQEGAKVVLAARRPGPLEAIAAQIAGVGGEAAWVSADLVTEAGAAKAAAFAVEQYGRVDILFNNLGDSAPGRGVPLHETAEAVWDALIDINLKGLYLVARAVLPGMIAQGSGVIIHLSSASPGRLAAHPGYGAGKGALVGLTQSLARQYRNDNIRAMAIALPGPVANIPDGRVGPPNPRVGRPGSSEDIAYAALFLASDEAAWVTGVVLTVDGGSEVSLVRPG
ncbi:MAG: SDR family NAD(P)-dependent oxidoreductase [Chloroflexota bacterium]